MLYINISKAYTLKDSREKIVQYLAKKETSCCLISLPVPRVAALRSEYFKDVFPASTMVEVKGLVNKDLMLEIEAPAALKE